MKENFLKWKETVTTFWTSRSKGQKGIFLGVIITAVVFIAVLSLLSTNTKYVPLYNNLSLQEVGQIKAELDTKAVSYELSDAGTTISVPEEEVETLLVDLASIGLPDSGNIDYSFFSENTSWGITDNEFNIMKLDAMQSELANLIKSIDGIEDAQVMINMPEDPVFASESTGEASASIVLNTKPGYQFQGNQVESLYHLVSKAVPNLSADNIVIMNQYFEYFDRNSQTVSRNGDTYTYQQTVKKDIERDIQRRLQQMLGTMVGADNVLVSVTADVDFTQENRTEELVEPVDIENVEGLPVSLETIQESYSGDAAAGGVAGTGDEDVTNYPAGANGDGDYELDKETINYEFNRIRKEIVESPYKVRDLGIQVAVDNVTSVNGNDVEYLTQPEQMAVEEGFHSILNSIVGTTIDEDYGEVVPEEKTSIVFQEFTESPTVTETTSPAIPTWMYVVGAILLLIIILLIVLLIRNRNKEEEEMIEETVVEPMMTDVPDMPQEEESESVVRRKQLEKIAKDNPEDFAKLLRSWIGED
ncbi:flagellar basal-body MS-ring/collar protein FliF [Oceanobacillus rekensis]|uniref:flagellar basal-body MS-ring/collar protein FliF n=1 Tax=Oceanobacillus rekensis TaxID=937927 RepID=UPI000B449ED2|nr:flagellar basal-body MS-ring/collar protein FliF [Oceanobacillus rekensis]